MSMLDSLVSAALTANPDVSPLRTVVEKELLHHDILRTMNEGQLLKNLTFMGGTCLRSCYGSPRLSEDLDFTGDMSDAPTRLAGLGELLVARLKEKYGLPVRVDAPRRDSENVHTWKVRITTRPDRGDLPSQRINIDVQTLPCRDPQPVVLRNPYPVDMGTMGLILTAETPREILVDKVIAVALRRNRVKNRDLWDMAWLTQRDTPFSSELLRAKLSDRELDIVTFRDLYGERCAELERGRDDFMSEMRRFLPPSIVNESISHPQYWQYMTRTIGSYLDRL